jgi:hypothetical protein
MAMGVSRHWMAPPDKLEGYFRQATAGRRTIRSCVANQHPPVRPLPVNCSIHPITQPNQSHHWQCDSLWDSQPRFPQRSLIF